MTFDNKAFLSVVTEAFALALKADMDECDAQHYSCFTLGSGDARYIAMFTRLPDGKTPMELHAEAKAEAERLRALLSETLDIAQLLIEHDEPYWSADDAKKTLRLTEIREAVKA